MAIDEFVHLGKVFQQKREEKNLSLKEVENATSIRLQFLTAIESGELEKLISPIYAQGFIKKYATFLSLDGEKILADYPSVLQILAPKVIQEEEFAFGVGTLELRSNSSKEERKLPLYLIIALSILIIATVWYLMR